METKETVFCQNHMCGKEYHKNFEKCPFCGTENPQYCKETVLENQKEEFHEGIWKVLLRLLISVIVTFLALVLLSLLQVTIGIDGVLIMYIKAGISLSLGVACNKFLKKKFSARKQ